MLGLVHRSVLGRGPARFRQFFVLDPFAVTRRGRRHDKHLLDPRDRPHLNILARSALGLVRVYNLLSQELVNAKSVSSFQGALQNIVKSRAAQGRPDWADTFSPRMPLLTHPLRRLEGIFFNFTA